MIMNTLERPPASTWINRFLAASPDWKHKTLNAHDWGPYKTYKELEANLKKTDGALAIHRGEFRFPSSAKSLALGETNLRNFRQALENLGDDPDIEGIVSDIYQNKHGRVYINCGDAQTSIDKGRDSKLHMILQQNKPSEIKRALIFAQYWGQNNGKMPSKDWVTSNEGTQIWQNIKLANDTIVKAVELPPRENPREPTALDIVPNSPLEWIKTPPPLNPNHLFILFDGTDGLYIRAPKESSWRHFPELKNEERMDNLYLEAANLAAKERYCALAYDPLNPEIAHVMETLNTRETLSNSHSPTPLQEGALYDAGDLGSHPAGRSKTMSR
jgi:hypothetical protein